MTMLTNSLSSIISSFTKLENKLSDFVQQNSGKIEETKAALDLQQQEQEKAERILKNVQSFTK